jgi:hypothetical protein
MRGNAIRQFMPELIASGDGKGLPNNRLAHQPSSGAASVQEG